MSDALRGALVGFGQVAEKAHAPAWAARREARIAAVAESSRERQALARRAFPGARVYASFEALLKAEKRLDFADIATPPAAHAPLAQLALRRRLHVLCEKPLALGLAELEALAAEAKRARRVLFTVHNWKHAPQLRKLRELIASGAIGEVRHLELHTLRDRPAAVAAANGHGPNWRTDPKLSGGGILVDHGWHQLYLLRWLLGQAPRKAWAVARGGAAGAEDEATCLIEFPRASAVLHLSWRAGRRAQWGLAYGSSGRAELQDSLLLVARGQEPPCRYDFPEPLSAASAHPDWFQGLLGDFLAALKDPALAAENLEEARDCLRLLEGLRGARQARSAPQRA